MNVSAPAPPPPPAPEEPLKTYFAIQLRVGEAPIQVARAVMDAAKGMSILFRKLEVMDTVTLGTSSFVRMRSEILNPHPILDRLYNDGRAVVSVLPSGEYGVRFQGGRVGKVSQTVMHALPKLGQSRMFRGTKFKYWNRQFAA